MTQVLWRGEEAMQAAMQLVAAAQAAAEAAGETAPFVWPQAMIRLAANAKQA